MDEKKNPFVKASAKKKHLKISLYGGPGVGKTFFALGFPNPAVIDLEGGTDFYADRFQFHVLDTKSFAEILEAVEFLETSQHDFKTLVIDPITVIWSALQDGRLEFKTKNVNKATSGEEKSGFTYMDWGQLKRFYSLLMTKLVNLPMHVVLVGRQKDEYEIKGNEMSKIGVKMEAEKSTAYIPDIFFRLESGKDGKRVAIFEKDRTGHFQTGSRVEDISFEAFRSLVEQVSKGTQEQVQHQKEVDAEKKDAAFFQEQEKNSVPQNGNKIEILAKIFNSLKIEGVDEHNYSNYLIEKYGITGLTEMSIQIFDEQKKILANIAGNKDIKKQFRQKLLELMAGN